MPSVDLVVTDLDGTFWHTDEYVPDPVLAAVRELRRRQVPLLVATGRRLASARGPLGALGLTPPAVLLNGALGVDLASGDRFHRAPFPPGEALAAYDAFVEVGLSPVVYVDHPDHDVLISQRPDTNPAHVEALGDSAARLRAPERPGEPDELRAAVAAEVVLCFGMIGIPFEPAEAAVAALSSTVEVHLDRSTDFRGLAALTTAPRGQSKWDGVLAYCASQSIDPSRVMAVADGPNDLELLRRSSVRVVPKVAHQSALDLATHVIQSARDGGWAEIPSLLD